MWMLNALPLFKQTQNAGERKRLQEQIILIEVNMHHLQEIPAIIPSLQGLPWQICHPINQVSCHRSSAAFCAVSKAASIAERQLGQLPYFSIQGFRHSS